MPKNLFKPTIYLTKNGFNTDVLVWAVLDIAAICGISKWRTSMHVYLEKLGEAPEEAKSEAAEWGTRLEPIIAEKFAQEHPEWTILEKKVIYSHPDHPWALANLDRLIICPKRGRGILEIKTASEYLKQEWDEGNIPDYYYVQVTVVFICHESGFRILRHAHRWQ
ncbi:hypothetical protein DX902_00030 [Paenibacillus jamilae]|uniref:YqaJ viral recombinase family protein n=1 Tax=Paenibacillus TaxID=44249 RepID=UPI000E3EB5D8|nr:YqaJ viral recombinase family protein [Paenibacillus jamilae]RFT99989.1 hypothetical protein DX902_00030 [Paenibacillus jamilae]